jgi:hypothetical protein
MEDMRMLAKKEEGIWWRAEAGGVKGGSRGAVNGLNSNKILLGHLTGEKVGLHTS